MKKSTIFVAGFGIALIGLCYWLNEPISSLPDIPTANVPPLASDVSSLPASSIVENNVQEQESRNIAQKSEVAKATALRALETDSLRLTNAAIVLLELRQELIPEINNAIGKFTDNLFKEELSRAYIEISSEGDEVIVVPPFDRRPLFNELKVTLTQIAGSGVSSLLQDRLIHDTELGSVTSEIRVSIESGPGGKNRYNFTRSVLSEKAYDPDIPFQPIRNNVPLKMNVPATMKIRTTGILADDFRPRIKFLFEAVDRLPKKTRQ